MKLNAKTAADKQLIEVIKEIRSERSSLSRYTVTETLKSGLNLKGQFQKADQGDGKFIAIELDANTTQRVFLANGVSEDKDSYDLVVAQANGEFVFNGIKYPKGSRKLMIQ